MDRSERAAQLFLKGYNCSQSVVIAFSDLTGLDTEQSARLASSFGGGMGRMREVCGAVSGMYLVLGMLYGYSDPLDYEGKRQQYGVIQELAAKFRERAGSIVCREILKNPPSDPAPTVRTQQFYAQRPCTRMIMLAVSLLEDYIRERESA